MPIHSKKQAQIETKVQVRALIFDKASTKIFTEYSNYSDVFSAENTTELPEHSKKHDHTIELKENKQLLFGLMYSLSLVKLKTLKIYIKTNLVNDFIQLFKSFTGVHILFD